ncbi:hypothetical protein KOR42_44270 [Thalassoglobus neptunius]|uniref:Uncharacterized protein n=1 Tax=Thalassoglobus neptunius TaxID=1938619 RepID=A0A5C5VZK4_9PLAN|nr:hypothetical protein [Thalassoglobus neptunius]TWT43547.1 hypothetical protein KOR42_44270 [Thalassoglobus neptunius]
MDLARLKKFLLLTFGTLLFTSLPLAAVPPPGPPWPHNRPISPTRSASEAPSKSFAIAQAERSGAPIGVEVSVRAAVANPVAGSAYRLYYQFRVHTGKGEIGPVLNVPGTVKNQVVLVEEIIAKYDWIEFYNTFDVTRGQLSGSGNLPSREPKGTDRIVFLRVEPHLWDVAAKRYLTDSRTPAAIIVASVGKDAKVYSLNTVGDWLLKRAKSNSDVAETMAILNDLDVYGPNGLRIGEAIEKVLIEPTVTVATKIGYIEVVDAKSLHWREDYQLLQVLEGLAAGSDDDLKAAAQKKLNEASNLN